MTKRPCSVLCHHIPSSDRCDRRGIWLAARRTNTPPDPCHWDGLGQHHTRWKKMEAKMKGQFKVWFQTPATFLDVSDWRAVCKIPRARVSIWNCEFRHQNLPESDLASTLEPSGTWPGSCTGTFHQFPSCNCTFGLHRALKTYPNFAPIVGQPPESWPLVPQKSAMIPDQNDRSTWALSKSSPASEPAAQRLPTARPHDAMTRLLVHPVVPHHLGLEERNWVRLDHAMRRQRCHHGF